MKCSEIVTKFHFLSLLCVKSGQIRSSFWSVFSRIWTEYGEIHIQSEWEKIRTRKNSVSGHFSRSALSANPSKWSNTIKQFVRELLSVFDHFVGLALRGFSNLSELFNFYSLGNHQGGDLYLIILLLETKFGDDP